MSTPIDPIDPIVIDKHGVSVAGHQLRGVTRWSARHEPERGVFEVQLTLVTSSCHVDLDASPHLLGAPFQPDHVAESVRRKHFERALELRDEVRASIERAKAGRATEVTP